MNLSLFEKPDILHDVRIAVQKKTGDGSSIGTGFLVRAPIPRHEDRFSILWSPTSVYHDPKQPVEMRFHARDKTDPAKA
jgi:hypothetical protein